MILRSYSSATGASHQVPHILFAAGDLGLSNSCWYMAVTRLGAICLHGSPLTTSFCIES